jgi:hypothetical protein
MKPFTPSDVSNLELDDKGEWVPAEPLRVGYAGKAQDGPWLRWIIRKVLGR